MSYTDITVVLDRSGSMTTIREDTIGGLNTFFADQKKEEGNGLISLAQFDHEFEMVFEGIELEHVAEITKETFVPRGNTALLDAMGRTINTTKARLDALDKDKKPDKVIIVVVTDGHENASREFTRQQVFNLVTERTESDDWQFIYLGANQDAIAVGRSLGVARGSTMSYYSSTIGTMNSFDNLSRSVRSRRKYGAKVETCAFTDAERQSSMEK